jgi:hypothetical protein
MDNPKSRIYSLIESLIQRSFLSYLALFTIVGVGSYLALHYGTNWFQNVTDNTTRVWEQAGVAFGIALLVCAVAFFSRLL